MNASESGIENDQRVAIADLADELGCFKAAIFKVVKRLGIVPQERREPVRGNQMIKTVSMTEAELIRSERSRRSATNARNGSPNPFIDECDVFYVIQLEPEHDPKRVKIGYGDLDERLRKHRCSAPFARIVKSWPCRRTCESAAKDSITAGDEQLGKEVFRTSSVEEIVARADRFFALMPALGERPETVEP